MSTLPPGAAAELSSLRTALGELADRITAIAEHHQGTEADTLAQDLFQVERSLREGLRRLEAAQRP